MTDRLNPIQRRPAALVAGGLGALGGLLAFALGPGLAVLVAPPVSALSPHGDWAMAQAGALGFVRDAWRWPLFAIEGMAEGHRMSAVFTDAIPLYAALWKLANAATGGAAAGAAFAWFQPLWLLLLFLSQGAATGAGLRLLGVEARGPLLAAGCLVALFPAFLHRVPVHGALACHAIVILALAMALAPPAGAAASRQRTLSWGALLAVATLVHAYLAAMALATFVLARIALLLRPPEGSSRIALTCGAWAVALGLAAVVWAAGYLEGGTPTRAGGFGYFRLNLAAPFMHDGHSLLPALLTVPDGQTSGYAYLPVGVLALLGMALGLVISARGRTEAPRLLAEPSGRWLTALAALAVLVFATAGRLSWGTSDFATIPLPELVERLGGIFRGSGRFVWLIAYAVLLLALARIAAGLGPRITTAAIAAAALATAVEMTPLRARTIPPVGPVSADRVLAAAIASSERLATLPAWGCDPLHTPGLDKELNWLAVRGGALIANSPAAARMQRDCSAGAPEGFAPVPEKGALLLLKRGAEGFGAAARAGVAPESCRALDRHALCRADWSSETWLPPMPAERLRLPARLDFGDQRVGDRHLGQGFATPEPWGVWSLGPLSVIDLAIDRETPATTISLKLRGFVPKVRPQTTAEIALWSRESAASDWQLEDTRQVTFERGTRRTLVRLLRAPLPAHAIRITLQPEAPVPPAELGRSTDRRPLGVGLIAIAID